MITDEDRSSRLDEILITTTTTYGNLNVVTGFSMQIKFGKFIQPVPEGSGHNAVFRFEMLYIVQISNEPAAKSLVDEKFPGNGFMGII